MQNTVTLSGGRLWFAPGQALPTLARPPHSGEDSVTALQWFYPAGQWLQKASFHFSFSSFLQLSISVPIRPINLESFQQSLYYYSLEGLVFTQAVSWHFLILSSVKWLNTHFSGSRMGRYIPFISVFSLTETLKCLGSQSFSCLLSSWLMLWVPLYLSSYCASCQILSYPILNPAFDVVLLIVQNK